MLSPRKRRLAPPPPPARRLPDELVGEILLRFPPDDPACLLRASVVCKPWRRIVSEPAFLPRFRAFHRRPPILGFFSNVFRPGGAGFFSTSAFPPPHRALDDWHVLDSRHGRVLYHNMESPDEDPVDLVVWDPVTDEDWVFPMPAGRGMDYHHNAGVLCAAAADGCDHLNCHGAPFLAVILCSDIAGLTSALVYSSESGEWSDPTPAEQVRVGSRPDAISTLLVGNTLFFLCGFPYRVRVMQYDLGERALSLIDLPRVGERPLPVFPRMADLALSGSLITAEEEDGRLGFACVLGSSIHLWSRQRRVIDLGTLLPADALRYSQMLAVIGFAEGVGVIFVRTDAGVFTIHLKSLQFGRVSNGRVSNRSDRIFPYI